MSRGGIEPPTRCSKVRLRRSSAHASPSHTRRLGICSLATKVWDGLRWAGYTDILRTHPWETRLYGEGRLCEANALVRRRSQANTLRFTRKLHASRLHLQLRFVFGQ